MSTDDSKQPSVASASASDGDKPKLAGIELEIDHVSRSHLSALLYQSLNNVNLKPDVWLPLLENCIASLQSILTTGVFTSGAVVPPTPIIQPPVPNPGLLSRRSSHYSSKTSIADEDSSFKLLSETNRLIICLKEAHCNASDDTSLEFQPGQFGALLLFTEEAYEQTEDKTDDKPGGTFFIKAPHSVLTKMRRILKLLVYSVWHLVLEVNLYKDFGRMRQMVPQEEPLRLMETSESLQQKEPTTQEKMLPLVPASSSSSSSSESIQDSAAPNEEKKGPGHVKKWSKTNFWKLLTGNKAIAEDEQVHDTKSQSTTTSQATPKYGDKLKDRLKLYRARTDSISSVKSSTTVRLKRRNTIRGIAEAEDWEMIAPALPLLPENTIAQGLKPASAGASTAKHHLEPSPDESFDQSVGSINPPDRFARVIDRMNAAILSISPDVVFPPPRLLQRLKDQESGLADDDSVTLEEEFDENKILLEADVSTGVLKSPQTAYSAASNRRSKIPVDARAGLHSLMSNNNSLDGTIKHQSLQFLFEKISLFAKPSMPACIAPHWLLMPYYRFSLAPAMKHGEDIRLGDLFDKLLLNAAQPCTCGRLEMEHVLSLTHHVTKVNLNVRPLADSEGHLASEKNFVVWTKCQECLATTQPGRLSDATILISFAKFMELLIYAPQALLPDSEALCPHVSSLAHHRFIKSFTRGGFVVDVSTEPQELFELRLPTSIAELSEEVDFGQSEQHETTLGSKAKEAVRLEVMAFYESLLSYTTGLKARLPEDDLETLDKMSKIDKAFGANKSDLLSQLVQSPLDVLNDVRAKFISLARSDEKRLRLWEKKHLEATKLDAKSHPKPSYFSTQEHVLPGSNVVLREDVPSSFLAYALSSKAFKQELGKVPTPRILSPELSPETPPAKRIVSAPVVKSSVTTGSRIFKVLAPPPEQQVKEEEELDPDDIGQTMVALPTLDLEVKPKHVLRSPMSILSLRSLHKQRSVDAFGLASLVASQPSTPSEKDANPMSRQPSMETLSDDQVLEDFLRCESQSQEQLKATLNKKEKENVPNLIAALTRRTHAPEASTLSIATGSSVGLHTRSQSGRSTDHSRVVSTSSTFSTDTVTSNVTVKGTIDANMSQSDNTDAASSIRSITSIGSSIIGSGFFQPRQSQIVAKQQSADSSHLKVKVRVGNKTLSVTVWFAKEFQTLRRDCDITEAAFVTSIADCTPFDASGGKTGANFFSTKDGRFILKQLTQRFSGSEKENLIALAPAYFAHYSTEAGKTIKPSLLAKVFAFFTYKVKIDGQENVKKVDMIVIENMFPPQNYNITRRFDLKGIKTRGSAKMEDSKDKTLWDEEWLSTYRALLLIYPHSKRVIKEAVTFDTAFLSSQGIIDYSLLLGLDDSHKTLVTGIVDILSIYNLQKLLESKSKQALKSAQRGDKEEVTIVKPEDYASRFVQNILHAFLSVPEKFSALEEPHDPIILHSPL